MKCPICGRETGEQSKFCVQCGTKIPRCPTCGTVMTKRVRFCTNDGTRIPEDVLACLPEISVGNGVPAPTENPVVVEEPVVAEQPVVVEESIVVEEPVEEPEAFPEDATVVFQPGVVTEPELDGTVRVTRPPAAQEPRQHFCTQCGQPCQAGQTICAACQAVAAVAAASAAAVPAEEEPKPKKQKKSKTIPVLLAIIILCLLLLGAMVGYVLTNDLLPFGDHNSESSHSEQSDREEADEEDEQEESKNEEADEKEPEADADKGTDEPAPEKAPAADSAPAGEQTAQTDTPAQEVPAPGPDYAGEAEVDIEGMYKEMREDPLGFFMENCDCMYFTWDDLEVMGLNAEESRLARNGIYARSGRIFQDESLSAFYDQFSWYRPTVSAADFQETMLNEYQIANRDLIIQYETAMGYR